MLFGGKTRPGIMGGQGEEDRLRELQQMVQTSQARPGRLGMLGSSMGMNPPRASTPLPSASAANFPDGAADIPAPQPSVGGLDGPWSNFMPDQQAPLSLGDPMKVEAKSLAAQNAPSMGMPGQSAPGTPPAPRLGGQPGQRAPWEQSKREVWASLLSNLGTSLMSAQAAQSGNFGAASSMNQDMQRRALEQRRRSQLGASMRGMGYSDDQIMVALSDPDSLAKNFNERLGTRVVAPGSSIVTGGPNGQAAAYSQPNGFEAYGSAQGLQPGTPEYAAAAQDYVLRQYGPTGIQNQKSLDDARTGNKVKLEGVQQTGRSALESQRQQGRVGLEGVRQGNRITTRQTPTYRDTNPAPARQPASRHGGAVTTAGAPTATGPNGQKLQWNGSAWVPAR